MNKQDQNRWLVVDAGVDWDGHWASEQQLAKIFSWTHRVLFVEQARTLLWFLRPGGGDTKATSKWRLSRDGVRAVGPRLSIVTPPFLLPFKYLPGIHQVNQYLRRTWLRGLLRELGIRKAVLITYDPASVGTVRAADYWCTFYYVNDVHAERGLWFNPNRLVGERETELMRSVDAVLALSESFAEKSRELGIPTFVVRNGVDVVQYMSVADRQEEPTDLASIRRPRIGIVGMLDFRLDTKLLETLASRHPEWSITLTGPVNAQDAKRFIELRGMPNVFFLGPKTPQQVPYYVNGLDVGLIPYRLTDYTKKILSLKVFEYSAMGVPTVSTAMPELEYYSNVVRLAANPTKFEELICECLATTTDEDRRRLREFAEDNTWAKRAEEVLCIMGRLSAQSESGVER